MSPSANRYWTYGSAGRHHDRMTTQTLTSTVGIPVGDGPPMTGYLARPVTPATTAVLVGMELFGVSAHVRDVCERLAAQGHLALAPDLHHRSAPGIELPADEDGRRRGFELLHQLTREQALADVAAAVEHLEGRGCRIAGMVGLSVGGHVAYLAATRLPLPAVAVVYGGWLTTTDIPLSRPEPTLAATAGITGRVLVLVGEQDQLIPATDRRLIAGALDRAGVENDVVVYPEAGHGFLCTRRPGHEPAAAADAWRRIDRLLGGPTGPA
jgi:carboxymethylenebutenolidase